MVKKLEKEASKIFCIDFEDGYGNRSNEEEDGTTLTPPKEVAKGMKKKSLLPFIGIRIKPFTEEMKERIAYARNISYHPGERNKRQIAWKFRGDVAQR